ncbi:GNAT family N-acetyltransferase [Actinosynnema sp. ALI-1.44]|nr:GNAT family N-acetyltransferase [Actinosynnema sp. ALI-1.44]
MLLRDVHDADLLVFHQQEQDPEAGRRSKFKPRDKDAFTAHWTKEILGDPPTFVQTVTVNGEPAGHVVAWWQQDQRFVGYWFGREYWGRGVGSRALSLFLRAEKVRPLYADPFAGNLASVRLLEKQGFERLDTIHHGEDEHVLLVLNAA